MIISMLILTNNNRELVYYIHKNKSFLIFYKDKKEKINYTRNINTLIEKYPKQL